MFTKGASPTRRERVKLRLEFSSNWRGLASVLYPSVTAVLACTRTNELITPVPVGRASACLKMASLTTPSDPRVVRSRGVAEGTQRSSRASTPSVKRRGWRALDCDILDLLAGNSRRTRDGVSGVRGSTDCEGGGA